MWIADQWKDYQVLDTSKGENWNVGATICWFVRTRRLSGTPRRRIRLEKDEWPLSPQ